MQLSPHFALREFTSSQTAARAGREIVPTEVQLAALQSLCALVLEPIRVRLGRAIVITSGLRPMWLNDMVGGSRSSAHLYGRAADLKVVGMSPLTFCRWVQRHAPSEGWPIDQCILEFGQWTHLAIAAQPRGQYLTARSAGGRTTYQDGIAA